MNEFPSCDRCGARAKVEVEVSVGLLLLLCAHHAYKHNEALKAFSVRPLEAAAAQ